jgi:hypothetical protein
MPCLPRLPCLPSPHKSPLNHRAASATVSPAQNNMGTVSASPHPQSCALLPPKWSMELLYYPNYPQNQNPSITRRNCGHMDTTPYNCRCMGCSSEHTNLPSTTGYSCVVGVRGSLISPESWWFTQSRYIIYKMNIIVIFYEVQKIVIYTTEPISSWTFLALMLLG